MFPCNDPSLGSKAWWFSFGPAGTGKTESVKALGHNLGKYVLVFAVMNRLISKLLEEFSLVFAKSVLGVVSDEFNRLNEHILSAVSTQIEAIELGIKKSFETNTQSVVELIGRSVSIDEDTGIFITMNPEYAGRNTLPENLKKLFRSFSMAKPDKEIIAEVILNSQGFIHAKSSLKSLFHFSLSYKFSFRLKFIMTLVFAL